MPFPSSDISSLTKRYTTCVPLRYPSVTPAMLSLMRSPVAHARPYSSLWAPLSLMLAIRTDYPSPEDRCPNNAMYRMLAPHVFPHTFTTSPLSLVASRHRAWLPLSLPRLTGSCIPFSLCFWFLGIFDWYLRAPVLPQYITACELSPGRQALTRSPARSTAMRRFRATFPACEHPADYSGLPGGHQSGRIRV